MRIVLVIATIFFPMISLAGNENNPRKGVALAYGWVNGEGGADKLKTGSFAFWWITPNPYSRSGRSLQTLWSDCDPLTPGCAYKDSIWPGLEWLASRSHYRDNLTYGGQVVVNYFNECDLPYPQCARSPAYMAQVYLRAREVCPNCAFFGPAVSSHDMFCDWAAHHAIPYHASIKYHGRWCWWQEFWLQVEQDGATPAQVAEWKKTCSVHHYYNIPWHGWGVEPRHVPATQPLDELQELGCEVFIISEYGACDPNELAAMTNAYNNDPRVIAFYAWTANLPDTANGTPCEVLLDWETGELTNLGRAFAASGN